MRLTIGAVLLSLLFSPVLHAQPDSLLHVSYAKRCDFITSLTRYITTPEVGQKAYDTLESLIQFAKENNDPAFATQLEFEKYRIHKYTDESDYKVEVKKIKKAIEKGYVYEGAEAYQIMSDRLWRTQKERESAEAALQAYELYKSMSLEEFPPRVRFQHKLATIYYHYHNYEKAKQLLLELVATGKASEYEVLGPFLNTLAMIYKVEENHDSAIHYLKILYKDELGLGGPLHQKLAAGNIGEMYRQTKQYDSALKWLKMDLATSKSRGKKGQAIFTSYVVVADVYLKKNDIRKAVEYIDSARQVKAEVSKVKYIYLFYSTYASILRAAGRQEEALECMDSLLIYKDSLTRQTDYSKLQSAEKVVADAKNAAKILKLENARDKSVWVRNFSIALVVFISVLTLLLINRSRLRHKAKELKLENEKNLAVAELAEFTLKLSERNHRLSLLEKEISELTNEQDIASRNEIINELRQSTILTDEEWDDFRILFEKVHSGYIQKVKDIYPDVTPAELRYITLTKLGMNNKEMANVLGIGTNTVRNYKFRLRKKFDLSESDDLEQMIKHI